MNQRIGQSLNLINTNHGSEISIESENSWKQSLFLDLWRVRERRRQNLDNGANGSRFTSLFASLDQTEAGVWLSLRLTCAIRTAMSAGETPSTREACPRVSGRTRPSLWRASFRIPSSAA